MNSSSKRILCAVLLLSAWTAHSQPPAAPSRGQLLYETHCIECHNQQMHWRDHKKARSWATLKAEVVRWQDAGRLGWDDADVLEVTRYLNDSIYRFAPPQGARRTRFANAG